MSVVHCLLECKVEFILRTYTTLHLRHVFLLKLSRIIFMLIHLLAKKAFFARIKVGIVLRLGRNIELMKHFAEGGGGWLVAPTSLRIVNALVWFFH